MKLYEVTFMQYTNAMQDTISDGTDDLMKRKFIKVGRESFIVREDQLEKIMKYGGGIRDCQFVGNLWVE